MIRTDVEPSGVNVRWLSPEGCLIEPTASSVEGNVAIVPYAFSPYTRSGRFDTQINHPLIYVAGPDGGEYYRDTVAYSFEIDNPNELISQANITGWTLTPVIGQPTKLDIEVQLNGLVEGFAAYNTQNPGFYLSDAYVFLGNSDISAESQTIHWLFRFGDVEEAADGEWILRKRLDLPEGTTASDYRVTSFSVCDSALNKTIFSDDADGDGAVDTFDAFPNDSAEYLDSDGDGIGNNADTDDDNDGVEDSTDAFPYDSTETTDADSDGIGDNADLDDDNDGRSDVDEIALGLDPLVADTDGDGIGDVDDPLTVVVTQTFPNLRVEFITPGYNPDRATMRLSSPASVGVFNYLAFEATIFEPNKAIFEYDFHQRYLRNLLIGARGSLVCRH